MKNEERIKMSLRDNTRKLFAKTLKEMLREMPMEKVRVNELCRRCGADRQTFYYHFRDKYDLATWIFAKDYESVLSDTDGQYTIEHAAAILRRMQDDKQFYRKVFSDRSQNAISAYIYDYFVTLGTDAVRHSFGDNALDIYTVYEIKSHSFACVGHTMEWLEGRSEYTPEEFARLQYQFMPLLLKRAYGIVDIQDQFASPDSPT